MAWILILIIVRKVEMFIKVYMKILWNLMLIEYNIVFQKICLQLDFGLVPAKVELFQNLLKMAELFQIIFVFDFRRIWLMAPPRKSLPSGLVALQVALWVRGSSLVPRAYKGVSASIAQSVTIGMFLTSPTSCINKKLH